VNRAERIDRIDALLKEKPRSLEQLQAAPEISGEPVIGAGGHLQLPDQSLPGFAVQLHGLTPEDSLHLQDAGLGDHRKLGCGVFLPG
jgi:hypothetical protein